MFRHIVFGILAALALNAAAKGSQCEESSDKKYHDAQGERHGIVPCLNAAGKVVRTTSWKHGNQDGPERDFDENGKLTIEMNFKDNKPHGIATWYFSGTQIPRRITSYKDGEQDGPEKTFSEDGSLKEMKNFKNGRREGP